MPPGLLSHVRRGPGPVAALAGAAEPATGCADASDGASDGSSDCSADDVI